VAGLIRWLRPNLDHRTVIRIIEQEADDFDPRGWDRYTGYGRIDLCVSLTLARDWPKKWELPVLDRKWLLRGIRKAMASQRLCHKQVVTQSRSCGLLLDG
jgi:hypothetical protein